MAKVLVAYASRHGATAGLAGWVADELRAHGHEAHAVPVGHVTSVEGYDAAVLGSAVYLDRWSHDAADLLTREAAAMRTMPVWLFGSGPVGGGAVQPLAEQERLAALVGARGSQVFGGALDRSTHGPVSGEAVDAGPGDWRDEREVRRWAREIAGHLTAALDAGVRS